MGTTTDGTDRMADAPERCGCEPRIEARRLVIDATDCPDEGRLSTNRGCRASAIAAVTPRVLSVRTRIEAGTYIHDDAAVGLLVAAARFATLVRPHDADVASRTLHDPLGTAREAAARGGRIAELAAETGLAVGARRVTGYAEAFGGRGRELNRLTSAADTVGMFHDIENAGELAPGELRTRYDERLRGVIEERGVEAVTNESGVEEVSALAEGDSPRLTLEDAAKVLATSDAEPDADAIVAETRDALLLGMTTAVLDVEAVESGIDGALDAREVQQKIEGRLPMSLDELAAIHGYIEGRKP